MGEPCKEREGHLYVTELPTSSSGRVPHRTWAWDSVRTWVKSLFPTVGPCTNSFISLASVSSPTKWEIMPALKMEWDCGKHQVPFQAQSTLSEAGL